MQIYYNSVYINSDAAGDADKIYAILQGIDPERFTHTPGTTVIRFDDILDITFGYSRPYFMVDGRYTSISYESYSGVRCNTLVLISDTIFYFLFRTNNEANNPIGGFCVIQNHGVVYLGVSVAGTSTNGQIDGMTFTNKSVTPVNPYFAIKKHANFELRDQNIIYINTSIIGDSSGNFDTLDGLCSCSTVAFGTTIGVNHRNYYAIGSNTLILDEQEDEPQEDS